MNKIDLLKKIVDNNPYDANTWYLIGIEYLEVSNENEALLAFSESLKYCDDGLKSKIYQQLTKVNTSSSLNSPSPSTFHSTLTIIEGGKKETVINLNDKMPKRISFEDVGGLENLKDTIKMKIIKPFVNPGLFSKFKKKIGGGILLYGPPGCGKTFIAKATAGEVDAKFLPVHISDILDPYIGQSEQNLSDIFDNARMNRPSILFFDEIDAIGYNRAKSSSHLMRPLIDQLLSEIEGIDSNTEQLLIIGATNMPWDVDPAFKRPGRFDKLIFVPPPDKIARKAIFQLKLSDRPVDNIDYDRLAQETELYSGADIENVVELATEMVLEEIMRTDKERAITTDDLIYAIKETTPSTLEWLRTVRNYVKYSNQSGLYNDVEKFLKQNQKLLK